MTKATQTKIERRYVKDPKGNLVKRYKTLPAAPTMEQGCKICKKPMKVSVGQIAFYHKECRRNRKQYKAIISR